MFSPLGESVSRCYVNMLAQLRLAKHALQTIETREKDDTVSRSKGGRGTKEIVPSLLLLFGG